MNGTTARFLWFDGPDAMAKALLGCCGRKPAAPGDGRTPTVDETHTGYRSGDLHVVTLLNRVVEELIARAGNGGPSVLWWGPLYDLAYSETRVPAAVRTWFRQSDATEEAAAMPVDPVEPAETGRFADFVERISFGVDPVDGSLEVH